MEQLLTVATLTERYNAGEKLDFLHFWGHQPAHDGSLSRTCFSQWFPAAFVVDGLHYPTAEHFMMAAKARLFQDRDNEQAVLQAKKPDAAKALGRKVRGFDEAVWLQHRFEIVCQASLAKFSQNRDMGAFLIGTGNKILVEASPVDAIWGIGLAMDDPAANDPNQWRGLNLLGFALMQTRQVLATQGQA